MSGGHCDCAHSPCPPQPWRRSVPTSPSRAKNPVSLLLPALPVHSPVTPLPPALTQNMGVSPLPDSNHSFRFGTIPPSPALLRSYARPCSGQQQSSPHREHPTDDCQLPFPPSRVTNHGSRLTPREQRFSSTVFFGIFRVQAFGPSLFFLWIAPKTPGGGGGPRSMDCRPSHK